MSGGIIRGAIKHAGRLKSRVGSALRSKFGRDVAAKPQNITIRKGGSNAFQGIPSPSSSNITSSITKNIGPQNKNIPIPMRGANSRYGKSIVASPKNIVGPVNRPLPNKRFEVPKSKTPTPGRFGKDIASMVAVPTAIAGVGIPYSAWKYRS